MTTNGNHARETARMTRKEKQLRALALRRAGLDYERIGKELGYANKSGAWKAVNAALEDAKREAAAAVLELELARLDEMSVRPYTAAINGDLKAVGAVLRIMERRAKLLNLDNPQSNDQAREGVSLLQTIQVQLQQGEDTYVPVADQEGP